MIPETKEQLAEYFDHTLLDCMAVESDIRLLCEQAVQYGFCSVCVHPRWVALCADILHGSGVKTCSVAGFPFGTNLSKSKASEAEAVIMAGADEVDMVADLASILTGDETYLRRDLQSVLGVCRSMRPAVGLKVIIESAALTDEQIRFVCRVGQEVGVDFLKTSTGYHKAGGARVEDVQLMAQAAPHCKIKAAGGIKTLPQAMSFIEAGVSRIGSSASIAIVKEFEDSHGNS